MAELTSFVLTIDVEPDDRTYDPSTRPRWTGFEKLFPEMQKFRRQLAKASGAAVHFSWLLRLDRQVESTYGRPDWPLEQYRQELGELRAAGDEIGVHTHAWRWEEGSGDWLADHGNPEWVGKCIEESLATFRRATGRAANIFTHGDHFLSNDVVRRLDRAGIVCDLTLEPGRLPAPRILTSERGTGSLPDLFSAPRVPYRPSPRDFLQPGVWRRRRLWMVPTTTGILPNPLTGSDVPDCQPLMLGAPFSVMRQVFENYLATIQVPMVVSMGRTDVLLDSFNGEQFRQFLHYAADHCQPYKLIFETPLEAIERYKQAFDARGYGPGAAAQFVLSTCFARPPETHLPAAPESVSGPARVITDTARLQKELTTERSLSRNLTSALQKLRDRLTEIETSRLWQWRRRWLLLRWFFGRMTAGMGGGLWKRLLSLTTGPGRLWLRQIAKLAARKTYLWLEEDDVEIVPRLGARRSLVQGARAVTYEHWLAKRAPRSAELEDYRDRLADLKNPPKISVLMPVFNPPLKFFRAAVQSVLDQVYPDWELCIADDASTDPGVRELIAELARTDPRIVVVYRQQNGHISVASNSALALANGQYCALLDQDDLLAPDALFHVAVALNRHPDLDLLYSDEDKVDKVGRFCEPHFKPQWCPDTLLTGNYVCHLLTARTELLREVGGFRAGFEGAQDFDLVLRLAERTNRIQHIPRVLYHWRRHDKSTAGTMGAKPYATLAGVRALEEALVRRGEPGTVEIQPEAAGHYSVRYALRRPGRIGVVIPTRDRADLLSICLQSLFERTNCRDFEVLVVDNGSRDPRTFELFHACAARYAGRFAVLRDDGPFNFSRLVNLGVRAVAGPYILLLNNDIEAIEPDWLTAMIEQAQRPSVGCVGARLLYPDGTVQHSGVVVGRGALATHVFRCADRNAFGYGNRLRTVTNFLAVTGACLMVRRQVFDAVGGFDEAFAVDFNDVDFCLRIWRAGYQNLLVPHAELVHHESVTRGHPQATLESSQRNDAEIALFRKRWPNFIASDPCVSPHLVPQNGDLRIVA